MRGYPPRDFPLKGDRDLRGVSPHALLTQGPFRQCSNGLPSLAAALCARARAPTITLISTGSLLAPGTTLAQNPRLDLKRTENDERRYHRTQTRRRGHRPGRL